MHLHDNARRVVESAPLSCRPGEVHVAADGTVVSIDAIVAAMVRSPEAFQFGALALDELTAQIRGATKLNFHHIASMARIDARRPLLLVQRPDLMLIDGRHRAARSRQLGYEFCDAFILAAAQFADFSL